METKFINNKQHIVQLTIWIVTKHLIFSLKLYMCTKIQQIRINKQVYVDFIHKSIKIY